MNFGLCIFCLCSFSWYLNWQLRRIKEDFQYLGCLLHELRGTTEWADWKVNYWRNNFHVICLCSVLQQQLFRRLKSGFGAQRLPPLRHPPKADKILHPNMHCINSKSKRKHSFPKLFFVGMCNTEKIGHIPVSLEPHFFLLSCRKLSSAQRAEYSQKLNEENNSSESMFIVCIFYLDPLSSQREKLPPIHTQ